MRARANTVKSGRIGERPELRCLVGKRDADRATSLEGLLRVSIGCSLQEALAWGLLVSLWTVFLAFVVGLTIGEYFLTALLMSKVLGVIAVVTGAFVGGWLIVLRTNSIRKDVDFRASNLSSDW